MNNIIVMFDNKDKILDISLYEFMDIEYHSDIPFVICNVTLDDYIEIKKQVKMGYLQERLPRLDINRKDYTKDRYIAGFNRGSKEISLSNPDNNITGKYSIVDGILRYNKDEESLTKKDMELLYSKNLKVYTTESYEDIINHLLLRNLDNLNVSTLNEEEVNMRLKALYEELYKLDSIRQNLENRKKDIQQSKETLGESFIKYSK